ncbi:hypothetical protein [Mesorhizobium sp. A556]
MAAFEAYRAAKLLADNEPTFENAMAAKRTWWLFLNIVDDEATANVVMFPPVNPTFGGGA